jgi:hypothetical protein
MFIKKMKKKNFVIKESDISLDILFNEDIDTIKDDEHLNNKKPKPITFSTVENEDGNHIRYEVEGGGKIIETVITRQNELTFFDFVKDMNEKDKKIHPKVKKSTRKTLVFQPQPKQVLSKFASRMSKISKRSRISNASSISQSSENMIEIHKATSRKPRMRSTLKLNNQILQNF